jgi:hypothetical protein
MLVLLDVCVRTIGKPNTHFFITISYATRTQHMHNIIFGESTPYNFSSSAYLHVNVYI